MKRMIQKSAALGALSLLVCNVLIYAAPAQVMFVRHGEKSEKPGDNNLNLRGYERSYALIPLFADMPLAQGGLLPKDADNKEGHPVLPAPYGQPVALYAKGQKHERNSVRSIMTLTPLAKELSLEVIHFSPDEDNCDKKDPKKYEHCYMPLVRDIMENQAYDGKIVLICWEHNAIPTIAQAFVTMYTDGATLPDELADPRMFKDFDRIFILTFKKGKLRKFENVSQKLLRGDAGSSSDCLYKIKGNKFVEDKKAA